MSNVPVFGRIVPIFTYILLTDTELVLSYENAVKEGGIFLFLFSAHKKLRRSPAGSQVSRERLLKC